MMNVRSKSIVVAITALTVFIFDHVADALDTSGKLLLTSGVSTVDGPAGGGLVPWALIGGYETEDQIGANVFYSNAEVTDFAIEAVGATIGLYDRVELSLARQSFNTRNLGLALGLGQDYKIRQTVAGVKVRLLGDAVLDQDNWVPQTSIGVEYKRNSAGAIVESLGAQSDSGVDVYVAATKILLDQSLLLNLVLRATRANQLGILGFGGTKSNNYAAEFEASLGYLLNDSVALGAEYRAKPDNLSAIEEDAWSDLFLAWTPTKNISLTAAYLSLGSVATQSGQTGSYVSLQIGF